MQFVLYERNISAKAMWDCDEECLHLFVIAGPRRLCCKKISAAHSIELQIPG
jgi:hypothetical protein